MNYSLGRASLLSFIGVAGMSMLTLNAQVTTLTAVGNGLYNTGVEADGTTLITPANPPSSTGATNQPDPEYTVVYNPGSPITFAGPPQNAPVATPPDPSATAITGPAYLATPLAGAGVFAWLPLANTTTPTAPANSQWITYQTDMGGPNTVLPANAPVGSVLDTPTSATTTYQLALSKIPLGQIVTINGLGAVDDSGSLSIKATGATTMSVAAPSVLFNTFTDLPTLTFISGASNSLDFTVDNATGFATGINLQLSGSYTPIQFTGLNLTPNQHAVLNYINNVNAIGSYNPCFGNLILSLYTLYTTDAGDFGAAMELLSPEKLSIFSSLAFNNATFLTQDMDDYFAHRRNQDGYFQVYPGIDTSGLTINDPTIDPQLSQIYSHLLAWSPAPASAGLVSDVVDPLSVATPPAPPLSNPTGWNVFIQGDIILGNDFSNFDLEDEHATTSSFTLGSDYQFSKNFLAGLFFNYSHTDANLDSYGSSATVDTYSPGIYASYAKDGWYGNALASYGHNAYTEQRNINIEGTYIEAPQGAPEGDQEVVDTDGGYDFQDNTWTYGPTVGFQYVHLNVDSFTEYGGCSSDLAVDNEAADSFRSRLGGHVIYHCQTGGVVITPFLDASWQHEFLDDSRGITSSFDELGDGQFTVYTQDTGRESALVATGVNFDIDNTETVFVNYQTQITPNYYFGQSVIAGLKVAF